MAQRHHQPPPTGTRDRGRPARDPKWWTLAAVCTRRLHAAARHHDRERRAARHPDPARRLALRPAVGDRRLRAEPGRPAADRRLARRPLRPAPGLRDRTRDLHARLDRVRRGAGHLLPAALAGLPGHRRGGDVRDRAGPAGQRRSTARTAARRSASSAPPPVSPSRSVRCSAARSPAGCPGAGSSSSTSRSAWSPSRSRCCGCVESKDPHAGRPDWFGFVSFSLGPRRARLRPDRGRPGRLGRGQGRRVAGRLRGAAGRLRGQPGCVQDKPMFDLGAAAQADLHRRPDRGVRRLGVDLLAAHLPGDLRAERPRLLRGRDRRPVPVPVRRVVLRRRARRPAHRAGAGEVADRARLPGPRRRPAADPRHPRPTRRGRT